MKHSSPLKRTQYLTTIKVRETYHTLRKDDPEFEFEAAVVIFDAITDFMEKRAIKMATEDIEPVQQSETIKKIQQTFDAERQLFVKGLLL